MNDLFLAAEWRKLAMINYVVDPSLLQQLVPPKTELDFWDNKCFVSLVAFMFVNTRVRGWQIPFHGHFEEVNLRFYVRYKDNGVWKRGVVFIREFVPLRMVTFVANTLYQEQYITVPMDHKWMINDSVIIVDYSWKKQKWHSLSITADNRPSLIVEGSEQEYITQHFWGYSRKKNHTSEYHVDHELWHAYPVLHHQLQVDYDMCYGNRFTFLNRQQPYSIYLVEGSPVRVYKDRII